MNFVTPPKWKRFVTVTASCEATTPHVVSNSLLEKDVYCQQLLEEESHKVSCFDPQYFNLMLMWQPPFA
jgi:hypothetical protein